MFQKIALIYIFDKFSNLIFSKTKSHMKKFYSFFFNLCRIISFPIVDVETSCVHFKISFNIEKYIFFMILCVSI